MQSSSGHNAAYAYGCVGDWVKKHGYFLIKNIRIIRFFYFDGCNLNIKSDLFFPDSSKTLFRIESFALVEFAL